MKESLETVKSYWNNRPCNIKHSKKEIGTKEYFDEVEKKKYFVESHIPPFAEFNKWENKKVLELGCGIGTDTVNFAKNNAKLTTIDLSEESVKLTKKRLEVYGLNGNVLIGDVENLSEFIKPEPFDLVYSFGVLHHTPNPAKAFHEIKKFMNNDSELRIMVYNRGSAKVLQILEQNNWDFEHANFHIANNAEAQFGCPVVYTYTQNEITVFLESMGYKVISVEIDHIFPWSIDEYKENIFVKAKPWDSVPDDLFRNLEKMLGWHLLVKAKLK